MRKALSWLQRYERFWSASLDRLANFAESKEADARKTDDAIPKTEHAAQQTAARSRKSKVRVI
jgi:hypothetical protein